MYNVYITYIQLLTGTIGSYVVASANGIVLFYWTYGIDA